MRVEVVVEVPAALRNNAAAWALSRRSAQAGARASRALVPVRTGDLRRSIVVEKQEAGWAWGSDLVYAPFVERGTKKMDAQPFIHPAVAAAVAAAAPKTKKVPARGATVSRLPRRSVVRRPVRRAA